MSKKPDEKEEPKPAKKRPRCNGTGMVSVAGSGNLSDYIPCKVYGGAGTR